MINNYKINSRTIKNINGLDINILENNIEKKKSNVILLLHGFPEISFSYRYLMLLFEKAGYYCVAPDQRGYGKTKSKTKETLNSFSVLNLTKDISLLIDKLNIDKYHLIGHDFGAYISSFLCLLYPKKILSLTLMSMPFSAPPTLKNINNMFKINKKLALLEPKRKHYQNYFSSYGADENIMKCNQGLSNFLRSYFYFKSYDYKGNKPFKLKSFTAREISKMPEYYIMKLNLGMAQTVKKYSPSEKEILSCKWLNNMDLKYYVKNYLNSGIKKPLAWYKVMLSKKEKLKIIKLNLPKSIFVPSIFISGSADWGMYQKPGDLEKMENVFLKNYFGRFIIKQAGHWVQQEQPYKTFELIIKFLNKL